MNVEQNASTIPPCRQFKQVGGVWLAMDTSDTEEFHRHIVRYMSHDTNAIYLVDADGVRIVEEKKHKGDKLPEGMQTEPKVAHPFQVEAGTETETSVATKHTSKYEREIQARRSRRREDSMREAATYRD